jgi:mannose-6-phosphate isomerase-like protein (cupin superfamily)
MKLRHVAALALITVSLTLASTLHAQEPHALVLTKKDLKFVTFPGLPNCFTGAVVRGDPNTGPFSLLEKLAPKCAIPWHWHSASEQLIVVRGVMDMEHLDSKPMQLGPEDYYFNPAHHVHSGGCPAGCTLFISVDGKYDVHYVDRTGKEISPAEAFAKH